MTIKEINSETLKCAIALTPTISLTICKRHQEYFKVLAIIASKLVHIVAYFGFARLLESSHHRGSLITSILMPSLTKLTCDNPTF